MEELFWLSIVVMLAASGFYVWQALRYDQKLEELDITQNHMLEQQIETLNAMIAVICPMCGIAAGREMACQFELNGEPIKNLTIEEEIEGTHRVLTLEHAVVDNFPCRATEYREHARQTFEVRMMNILPEAVLDTYESDTDS